LKVNTNKLTLVTIYNLTILIILSVELKFVAYEYIELYYNNF